MLSEIDPSHASDYAARGDAFAQELARLEHDIESELSGLEQRAFLVLHPAWGWFAKQFDLEQIALEHEGKQPGPRQIIPLIERARSIAISTIFVQRGLPHRSARWVARELSAEIVELDPLARDWFESLRRAAREIRSAGTP